MHLYPFVVGRASTQLLFVVVYFLKFLCSLVFCFSLLFH